MRSAKPIIAGCFMVLLILVGEIQPVEDTISRWLVSTSNLIVQDYDKQSESISTLKSQAKLESLEQENSSLRKALQLQQTSGYRIINSYVIGRSNSLLTRDIKIDKGSKNGIKKNQIVLANGIVIGKITSLDQESSKVQLTEDQNFRLEVEFGGNRGILKGFINGVVIDRVLPGAQVVKNTLITTVAQPNNIPPGLPVGRVVGLLHSTEQSFRQVQIAGYEEAWRAQIVQVITNAK